VVGGVVLVLVVVEVEEEEEEEEEVSWKEGKRVGEKAEGNCQKDCCQTD
jgi:hypothetical protein